eukprot:scaffold7617_cov240-Skeletonema_menzelii.AAC.1
MNGCTNQVVKGTGVHHFSTMCTNGWRLAIVLCYVFGLISQVSGHLCHRFMWMWYYQHDE